MKYSNIISTLIKAEPVLDNAEELTDRIMQQIERMPVGMRQNRVIRFAGVIAGTAASLLICLFLYETLKFPASPAANYSEREFLWLTSSSKINPPKMAELNREKKGEIIKTVIKSKETQRMRKEELKLYLSSFKTE